jgi:hypothetical protein
VDSENKKLLLTGCAILCCIILTPYASSLLLVLGIPFIAAMVIDTLFRFVLPFILIGMFFRDIPPARTVLVIVVFSGILRILIEIFLSPVPFILVSSPDYLVQVLAYVMALSIVAAGVSLFSTRKIVSLGIVTAGILAYGIWVIVNLN